MLAVTTCRAGLAAVYAPSKDKIRQKMEEAKNKSSWGELVGGNLILKMK